MRRLWWALSCVAVVVVWTRATVSETTTLKVVTEHETLEELKSAPQDNVERVERLRALYLEAGAKPEDIVLQEVKAPNSALPPLHNVIVTKQGATDHTIVIGGHLDKVSVGNGIIDNWSGASMATNIYQALRDVPTKHTLIFVGFAYEERGLLGSRAYVAAMSEAEKKRCHTMLNLECVGVDAPFIWANGSTDALEKILHEVAERERLPLRDHELHGVSADSIPFERVGIPNLTIDGLDISHFHYIHSENDTFDRVTPQHYYDAYKLATHFVLALDRALPLLEK